MFRNLAAEMARNGITNKDIAICLGVSEKTIRNYLSRRTKIPWEDTLKVKHTFFPNIDVSYLFAISFDGRETKTA